MCIVVAREEKTHASRDTRRYKTDVTLLVTRVLHKLTLSSHMRSSTLQARTHTTSSTSHTKRGTRTHGTTSGRRGQQHGASSPGLLLLSPLRPSTQLRRAPAFPRDGRGGRACVLQYSMRPRWLEKYVLLPTLSFRIPRSHSLEAHFFVLREKALKRSSKL